MSGHHFILFVFLFTVVTFPKSSGERILFFFGGGSYSMKISAYAWANELANRGHQVTFVSSHDKVPISNSKVRDLTSTVLKKVMDSTYDIDRFQQRKEQKEFESVGKYSHMSVEFCEDMVLNSKDDPVLQNMIYNDTYDLIVNNVIFGDCGFIFAAKFGVQEFVPLLSGCGCLTSVPLLHNVCNLKVFDGSVPMPWMSDLYGFSAETSWIPDVLISFKDFPLSFVDRAVNTLRPLYWYWCKHFIIYPGLERIVRKAFPLEPVPSFYDVEKDTSLVVVNSHPSTDFAYSLPPLVLQIGGIQSFLPEQKIPEVYQDFMDGAGKNGVILISFGSTINLATTPSYYKKIFLDVIKKHSNVRFLMKWTGQLPPEYQNETIPNLMTSNWLPQRELLRHKNVKAFITHGGLNSLQEATFYGVPLIAMPLFADQDYNAYRIDAQKVGFRVEIRDLTFDIMNKAVHDILTDQQYKKNMEVKSHFFRHRPQNPLDLVVHWTEFILTHDDVSTLKPMNKDLTWYQRRLLDVYAAYAAVIFIPLGLVLFLIFKLTKKATALLVYTIRKENVKQKMS